MFERSSKLHTIRFSSQGQLQTPALDQKMRLGELYLVIGGLGGQKREINPQMTPKPVDAFKECSSEYLPQRWIVKRTPF